MIECFPGHPVYFLYSISCIIFLHFSLHLFGSIIFKDRSTIYNFIFIIIVTRIKWVKCSGRRIYINTGFDTVSIHSIQGTEYDLINWLLFKFPSMFLRTKISTVHKWVRHIRNHSNSRWFTSHNCLQKLPVQCLILRDVEFEIHGRSFGYKRGHYGFYSIFEEVEFYIGAIYHVFDFRHCG